MSTRRDGTEPVIAHGAVYLRAGEREGRYLDVHRVAALADEWRAEGG